MDRCLEVSCWLKVSMTSSQLGSLFDWRLRERLLCLSGWSGSGRDSTLAWPADWSGCELRNFCGSRRTGEGGLCFSLSPRCPTRFKLGPHCTLLYKGYRSGCNRHLPRRPPHSPPPCSLCCWCCPRLILSAPSLSRSSRRAAPKNNSPKSHPPGPDRLLLRLLHTELRTASQGLITCQLKVTEAAGRRAVCGEE